MADLIEKHQLAAKLFEFTSLQHLADEQVERHSPVFRGQNKVLVALSEKSLFYIPEYLDYLSPEEWTQLAAMLDKMNDGIRDHLKLDGIQNLGTRIMLSQLNRKTESENKAD